MVETLERENNLTFRDSCAIRWTREQCRMMDELGVLPARYELIEGDILNKMPQKPPHASTLMHIIFFLATIFSKECLMTQASINVAPEDNPTSEPEPDIVVLRSPVGDFKENPPAEEVVLLVEVADSSLNHDTTVKARLYARAGIPEYIVADVGGRRLIRFTNPQNGNYETEEHLALDATFSLLCKPEVSISVADWFPQVSE